MAMADSVFISYRRTTSKYAALLVFKDLTQNGYDVFLDYESIDSGEFEEQILNQIAIRKHFIAILSPGCLDRCLQPGDWLRKEIEYAIEKQRNVVPLLFDNFDFKNAQPNLTGKLAALADYNGLSVPDGYFDEAMVKLRERFLQQPLKGVIEPIVKTDTVFVTKALQKAFKAAEGKEGQVAAGKYLASSANLINIDSRANKVDPQSMPWSRNFQASKSKWLPDPKSLQERIAKQIYDKVTSDSEGKWEIGLFRISYSYPKKFTSRKKEPKWVRDSQPDPYYSLYSELINIGLLSRYDPKTYSDNKEELDKIKKMHSYSEGQPVSASNFIVPTMEEVRMELILRRRLNLELNMYSETKFSLPELENYAQQLIDIHTAHHIPTGEVHIKIVQ